MATTSAGAALSAVAAIEKSRAGFAVLHDEPALARGEVASDVDLVVDRDVFQLARTVMKEWVGLDLHPVVVWPYDVGGTGSIFLTTSDAGQGVQLDVLHDTKGSGRYGARSDLLLGSAVPGERFTTVAAAERAAYLLAKRLSKGEVDKARELSASLSASGVDLEVLRPDIATMVGSFLANETIPEAWERKPSWGHLVSRLRQPAGAWVELLGEDAITVAAELAMRFGRILPHARSLAGPHIGGWATSVAPIRWRAGLVVSHGKRIGITPRPDISIDDSASVSEAAAITVSSLAARYG